MTEEWHPVSASQQVFYLVFLYYIPSTKETKKETENFHSFCFRIRDLHVIRCLHIRN